MTFSPPVRSRVLVVCALCVVALGLASCSSTKNNRSGRPDGPVALLAAAKQTIDSTDSLHFSLTSSNVPDGAVLRGGEGSAARPDKFKGDLKVAFAGTTANVKVISVGGKFYAQLPITPGYSTVDPAQFGVGDPGKYMRKDGGVSTLLIKAENPKLGSKSRVNGDVVQQVDATIPGIVIKDLLVSADPATPVRARFSIVEGSNELRQAVLTGPFFKKGVDSTLTIVLDRYGDKVDISPPKVG
ncbi:MAG: LppX_LprAFG lipoprotein [Mycobacteriales bacterium]